MKLRTIIATATTAAVLATGGVALAGAADGSSSSAANPAASTAAPAAKPDQASAHLRRRARLRLRKLLKGAGGVVTTAIGIDRPTLRQGLRDGLTIAQIATAHGVAPQTVIDALVAAADKKLEAAATAGKISSERVARIEQRLPARITDLVDNWHPKHLGKQATP
jgi:hypothetical protein